MIYFLDSTNRKYTDKELNSFQKLLFKNGFLNSSDLPLNSWELQGDFAVVPSSIELSAVIKKGFAVHTVLDKKVLIEKEQDSSVVFSSNSSGSDRYDTVIIRIKKTIIENDNINEDGSNIIYYEVLEGGTAPLTDAEIQALIVDDIFVRIADVKISDGATIPTEVIDKRVLVQGIASYKPTFEVMNLKNNTQTTIQEVGDFWFNENLGTLNIKTVSGIITFTAQQWDFYSDGVTLKQDTGNALFDNEDHTHDGVYSVNSFSVGGGDYVKNNFLQPFTLTDTFGSFEFMKDTNDPDGAEPIHIKVCEVTEVSGVYQPSTVIETFSISATEWQDLPQNTMHEIFVDSSLYTIGTKYALWFDIQDWNSDDRSMRVTTTSDVSGDNLVTEYNYLSSSDQYYERDYSLVYRINKLEKIAVGQDTQNEKLMQTFTGISDIEAIAFQKAEDVGTPTEDFEIYIKELDSSFNPIGDKLATITITKKEYEVFTVEDYFKVTLQVKLNKSKKYGIILSPLGLSDTNYRQLFYSNVSNGYIDGKLRQYDGANWNDVNYDLRFKLYSSPVGKVVKVNNNGEIDSSILPRNNDIVNSRFICENLNGEFSNGYVKIAISPNGKNLAVINYNGTTSNNQEVRIYEILKSGALRFRSIQRFSLSNSTLDILFRKDEELFVLWSDTGYNKKRLYRITDLDTYVDHDQSSGYEVSVSSTDGISQMFYNPLVNKFFFKTSSSSQWFKIDGVSYADEGTVNLTDLPNYNQGYAPAGIKGKYLFYRLNDTLRKYLMNDDGSYTFISENDSVYIRSYYLTNTSRQYRFHATPNPFVEDSFIVVQKVYNPTYLAENQSHYAIQFIETIYF